MVEKENLIRSDLRQVFVSYSGADRPRVTGLGLLLEALGHEVFLDHKTIRPGARWKAKLQEGLDQAEVLVVFWTKRAAQSEWVRKEYEYFHVRFPDRLLVPVLGDETPLAELLKAHQHSDFVSLVNELLALKRQLVRDGVNAKGVRQAILKRLADAGIDMNENDRKKLFGFVGVGAISGLGVVTAAFGLLNTATEAAAQLSGAQAALVVAGVISGGVVCGVTDRALRQTIEPVPVTDEGLKTGSDVKVLVNGRSTGLFGTPLSGQELQMTHAIDLNGGEEITLTAEGVLEFGDGLSTDPSGIDIERSKIAGHTPLEDSTVSQGKSWESLSPMVTKVGALMGAYIEKRRAEESRFVPVSTRKTTNISGIRADELFLVGKGPFSFGAPNDGKIYLGVNEPWVGDNRGTFEVTITLGVAGIPAGAPDLTKVWGSTYGVIHLTRNGNAYEGWYGNENKTLRGTLSNQGGTWIFFGEWGRKNDPGYKGGFRFTFTSPTAFTGNWWQDTNPLSTTAWKGSI